MGFSIMAGVSVLEFAMIFVLRYFANKEKELDERERTSYIPHKDEVADISRMDPGQLDLKAEQSIREVTK